MGTASKRKRKCECSKLKRKDDLKMVMADHQAEVVQMCAHVVLARSRRSYGCSFA